MVEALHQLGHGQAFGGFIGAAAATARGGVVGGRLGALLLLIRALSGGPAVVAVLLLVLTVLTVLPVLGALVVLLMLALLAALVLAVLAVLAALLVLAVLRSVRGSGVVISGVVLVRLRAGDGAAEVRRRFSAARLIGVIQRRGVHDERQLGGLLRILPGPVHRRERSGRELRSLAALRRHSRRSGRCRTG